MDFLFTLIDPVATLDNSSPPVRYVVVILKGSDQFASNFFVLLSFSFLIKRMSIDLENQTWSPLSNFFLLSVSGGTTDLAWASRGVLGGTMVRTGVEISQIWSPSNEVSTMAEEGAKDKNNAHEVAKQENDHKWGC